MSRSRSHLAKTSEDMNFLRQRQEAVVEAVVVKKSLAVEEAMVEAVAEDAVV
jgi:hypothetical protein